MNTNDHCLVILTFFLFSLLYFPYLVISETPCPYPCYPPPTGFSSSTPSTIQPPPYPPPSFNYPSPSGNLPNYPSPPYTDGGGSGSFYGPPPPDAILPYFPFYFRKPPHQTDETSSSSGRTVQGKLSVRILTVASLVIVGVLSNICFFL